MEFVSLIWLLLESSKFRLLFFKSLTNTQKKNLMCYNLNYLF